MGRILWENSKVCKKVLKKTIENATLSYDKLFIYCSCWRGNGFKLSSIVICFYWRHGGTSDSVTSVDWSKIVESHCMTTFRRSWLWLTNVFYRTDQENAAVQWNTDHFCKKWRTKYLVELRESRRYQTQTRKGTSIMSVGDVIIVQDQDQPRGLWKLAIVKEVLRVSHGHIRGAV